MAVTSAGLVAPTLTEILEAIEADQRANISPALDQGASSPLGQLNRINARQLRLVWEALEALYTAGDPNSASGVHLDRISALGGTQRRAATKSTVYATVNIDAGASFAQGELVAHVDGDPTKRFASAEIVQNTTGAAADFTIVFEAEDTGPIAAPAGTLTEIATPVAGWNSVTNSSDATLGSKEETDSELRARRLAEIRGQGSSTVDAVRAAVLQSGPGVEFVSVKENDSDAVVSGIDPHSIQVVVYGPSPYTGDDDKAVAQAIFNTKAAGVGMTGTTTVAVRDEQGYDHNISFVRAYTSNAGTQITLEHDGINYPGDSDAAQMIADAAKANLSVGDDLDWSDVVVWAMAIPGVLRVTSVGCGAAGAAPYPDNTNFIVSDQAIAFLDSSQVFITSSEGTP